MSDEMLRDALWATDALEAMLARVQRMCVLASIGQMQGLE